MVSVPLEELFPSHINQDNEFSTTFIPTIGVDFKIKTIDYKQKRIKLQLWDTAGQERFQAITRQYYKGADGIMIVYDVTTPQSFYHVRDWKEDIERLGVISRSI